MIKFFVVFLAFVAAAQASCWTCKTKNEMKAIHDQCIAANQVSEEDIAKMKNYDYPDNESVRKFVLCCTVNMGFFSTQQGYYINRLTQHFPINLPPADVLAMMTGCVDTNQQNSTFDVWAFRCHKCLLTTAFGQNAMKCVNSAVYGI